ncbi:hypothetical protein EBL_c04910 [Shimwellia blattae DSM 4481 = NBRC 105725]|uniref:Pectate lyase superfamily protein domain-containing protein n=2 Tax=Shimwellia blattae TaxID=563 RepID=I2B513_SHIBC|nr:hypothetical protein EBL_c04910 [Shimwellia blattae DSM 4481 = NBRC 105725]
MNRRNILKCFALLSFSGVSTKLLANDPSYEKNDIEVLKKIHHSSVSPKDFGAVGDGKANDTIAVLKMIDYAVSHSLSIDLRGGPWKISNTIDFTDIKEISCDWTGRFIVDPVNFDSNCSYVVTLGSPDSSFRSRRANNLCINGLLCIVSTSKKKKLNGLFIKGSLLKIDAIRVIGFNGEGVNISATWDSSFVSISTEDCGNTEYYQFSINRYGDTSNCLFIGRLQCERANHKCFSIECIRSVINTIHAERTIILIDDEKNKKIPSKLNYVNVKIDVGNTTINQIFHDVSKKSKYKKSSVLLNIDHGSIKDVQMNDSVISTSFGRFSEYINISARSWFFSGNQITNNVISNPKILQDITVINDTKIQYGKINNLSLGAGCSGSYFLNVNIAGINTIPDTVESCYFQACVFECEYDAIINRDSLKKNIESKKIIFNDCRYI